MTFYVRDHTHRICIEADIHSHIFAHVLRLSHIFFNRKHIPLAMQVQCCATVNWKVDLKKKNCFLRPINLLHLIKKYFFFSCNQRKAGALWFFDQRQSIRTLLKRRSCDSDLQRLPLHLLFMNDLELVLFYFIILF